MRPNNSSGAGLVSARVGVVSELRAEDSSSTRPLGAGHGGRPRRRARENVPRWHESPRGRFLLDPEGRDLLPARPQRRGEDDTPADPRHATQVDRGPRVRPRPRRDDTAAGDPPAHRGGAPRGTAADAPVSLRPHPLLLSHPRAIATAGPRTNA